MGLDMPLDIVGQRDEQARMLALMPMVPLPFMPVPMPMPLPLMDLLLVPPPTAVGAAFLFPMRVSTV